MNSCAAATCGALSHVTRRTRTLVSTALMPFSDVSANALFQLFQRVRFGRMVTENGSMKVKRSVPAGASHGDAVSLSLPFENRAGSNTQRAPNISGNGDLPL